MAERTTYTSDETLALVNQKSTNGTASFLVKLHRRRGGQMGLPEHVATLGEANMGHIANPEVWIPRLAGGGSFQMAVYPSDSPGAQIGGYLQFSYQGQPIDVDPRVARGSSWQGPPVLIFPELPDQQPGFFSTTVSPGAPGVSPHTMAPQAAQSVPGGVPPGLVSQGSAGPLFDNSWQLRELEGRIAQREREIAERERKAREELAEERARLDRERLKAEMQAEIRAVQAQAAANVKQGPGIAEIIGAIGPIVQGLLQSQAEARLQMLKMQQDSANQLQAIVFKATEPKGMSSEVQAILEITKAQLAARPTENAGMGQMLDAMGMITKNSIAMMETVADIQIGQSAPDHPMLQAIREVAKGLSAMSSGAAKHAKAQFAPQRALPPPTQQLPPQAQPQQGFAGAPQARPKKNPVDTIERMIRAHIDVEEVAEAFFRALPSAEMQAELAQVDGDVVQLFMNRLGQWLTIPANQPYVAELAQVLQEEGRKRGIIPIIEETQAEAPAEPQDEEQYEPEPEEETDEEDEESDAA